MCISSRRGVTLLNVLVGFVCVVIVVVVLSSILFSRGNRQRRLQQLKDMTQLLSIHQSWLTFSNEFSGILPTPGLVKRLPFNGAFEPGRGLEDVSQNTTANLYSLCVMNNLFTPQVCIGLTEPSPHVRVFNDNNTYNFESYSPANGVFWDTNFRADLHDVSNVSYAHVPLIGRFKNRGWRATMDNRIAIIGTRGPLNGIHDPNSITNRIYPPDDRWIGIVVYQDGSAFMHNTFTPKGNDNIFAFDHPEADADAMLTFTKAMTAEGPVIEHD